MELNDRALEIIDKYLDEVGSYLPEDIREDICTELRTHLIEMAKEMGGLTVENAEKAIKTMGDPKKLAQEFTSVSGIKPKKSVEFSFKWGDKVYKFGFDIDADLLESVYSFMKLIIILVTIGVIARIATVAIFYPSSGNLGNVIISGIMTIVYILVLFPIMLWLLSFLEESESTRKRRVKKVIIKKKEKRIKRHEFNAFKVSGFLIWGGFVTAFGIIIIWLTENAKIFTWVTSIFIISLGIGIVFSGMMYLARAFTILIEGNDSSLLKLLGSFSKIFLLPSLFLINLYPDQLQYIWLYAEGEIVIYYPEDILKYIIVEFFPQQYVSLIQLFSILAVVLIVISLIFSVLQYKREKAVISWERLATREAPFNY